MHKYIHKQAKSAEDAKMKKLLEEEKKGDEEAKEYGQFRSKIEHAYSVLDKADLFLER